MFSAPAKAENSLTRSGAQPWIADFREHIEPVLALKAGWAGPGSQPVSRPAVYLAEHLLGLALAGISAPLVLPSVVPGLDGEIQLEWHRGSLDLEVLIDEEGQITALLEDHSLGVEIEKEGDEALDLFIRWAPRAAQARSDAAHVDAETPEGGLSLAA